MLRIDAYEKFKARILNGDLKPGQMVSQRELADMVGIPLGPAREAIQRLAFESLLRVHPNRGVQVSEITYRTIRSAYELRTILESEAVKRFVQSSPDEEIMLQIKAVEDIIARSETDQSSEFMAEAVEVDWRMHESFFLSMDNEIITEIYQINHSRIVLFRTNNRLSKNRLIPAMNEHLNILTACLKRDQDLAVKLLSEHIAISKENALNEL